MRDDMCKIVLLARQHKSKHSIICVQSSKVPDSYFNWNVIQKITPFHMKIDNMLRGRQNLRDVIYGRPLNKKLSITAPTNLI